MPTDQVQLVVSAVKAAPLDYTVPAVAEIEPLSVYAEYDGSGAAGSFVPTIQIISDSGHVVANAPIATTLAAGASADVSWFPRVGAAAAAATSSGEISWSEWHDLPLDSATALDDYPHGGGTWGWTIDTTQIRAGYWKPNAPALNRSFDVRLPFGPAYSAWSVTLRANVGPGFGTLNCLLLKLAEYDDVDTWAQPLGLTSSYQLGSPTFSTTVGTFDCYAAGAAKNVDLLGLVWRVGNGSETTMTNVTFTTDGDGFKTTTTGPGLYVMRFIVNTKAGASTGYDMRISSLVISRTDGRGNA